ncbi:DUF2846 domain-containing protein [Hydrogenophaga sp.]|uniref:DUF2846 domain-containing protein n=1 Tax=Hydrogenophaga sp. TaxID=1904254 RepID=UPI0035B4A1D6
MTHSVTRISFLSAALLAAVLSTGCASVNMADATQDAARKTFTAPADKAGIYVYRNETFGAAIKMPVAVDGQLIGQTAANTYLYKEVVPGKHKIESLTEGADNKLEVDVKPGTLTYIWQEVKMGMWAAASKLHLVSPEQGKKGVMETKLAVTQ